MAAQQLLKIVYALDIKLWVRWCTCSMWRMLLPYYLLFLISIILFLKIDIKVDKLTLKLKIDIKVEN